MGRNDVKTSASPAMTMMILNSFSCFLKLSIRDPDNPIRQLADQGLEYRSTYYHRSHSRC